MAVAFVQIAAKTGGGSGPSLALPAARAGGDMLIAGRVAWSAGTSLDDEPGWTPSGELEGGTGSSIDNHVTKARADRYEVDGGEANPTAFSGTSLGGVIGVVAAYSKGAGTTWDVAFATANDSTHGINRDVGIPSATPHLQAGDVVVAIVAVDTDAALTITTNTISATGTTFGTTTRRTSGAGNTSGQDGNIEIFDAAVTAGGGTQNLDFTMSTGTSQCGPVVFVRLREVASGNNFTETPGDSEGLTDALALGHGKAVTDAEGLTDARALAVGQARTDALGLADAVVAAKSRDLAVPDSLGLADAVTATLGREVTPTDTLGLTDGIQTEQSKAVAPTDALGLTDTVVAAKHDDETQTDALGLTDAVATAKQSDQATTDNLGLTDAVAIARSRDFADSLGLADTVQAEQSKAAAPTDNLGLTDAAARQANYQRTIADTAGLADAVSISGDRALTLQDSAGLTDTAASTASYQRALTESVGVADAATADVGKLENLADSLGLTDARTISRGKGQAETVGMSDALTFELSKVLNDAAAITDAALTVGAYARTLAEQIGLTDLAESDGGLVYNNLTAVSVGPRYSARPVGHGLSGSLSSSLSSVAALPGLSITAIPVRYAVEG